MNQPYNRLTEESDQAYQAFVRYRYMGVERSITAVARQLNKSRPLIGRWSAKYNWIERVAAYDQSLDAAKVAAEQRAVAKATEKAVAKRELTKDRVLEEAAALAFSKLTEAARWTETELILKPSDELPPEIAAAIESVEVRYDKDGNPIRKIKLHNKTAMLSKLGEHFGLWENESGSPTANFFQFFLHAARSGAIDEEVRRRKGLNDAVDGEIVDTQASRDADLLADLAELTKEEIYCARSVP